MKETPVWIWPHLLKAFKHFDPSLPSQEALVEKIKWRVKQITELDNNVLLMPTLGDKKITFYHLSGTLSRLYPKPTGDVSLKTPGVYGTSHPEKPLVGALATILIWGITNKGSWVLGQLDFKRTLSSEYQVTQLRIKKSSLKELLLSLNDPKIIINVFDEFLAWRLRWAEQHLDTLREISLIIDFEKHLWEALED
jgi:hypothetical protein